MPRRSNFRSRRRANQIQAYRAGLLLGSEVDDNLPGEAAKAIAQESKGRRDRLQKEVSREAVLHPKGSVGRDYF